MNTVAQLFVALAGVLHLVFFALESVLFRKKSVQQRFLIKTEAEAEAARPWAFNQGFYNLFLAAGAIGGLIAGGDRGHAIALFSCACMLGAGLVLIGSDRRMAKSAAIQAGPPLLALVLAAVL